jgi:precorrin-3B synthase
MTATAIAVAMRRGACPGLSAPMPTGDGLLVRLMPSGTIPLAAFAGLCAAAQAHGNGIIEVTSRGSIQVRGLTAVSAKQFAADIAALDIAAEDGVPILCDALAGLDPGELLDAAALAADLRRAIAQRSLAMQLGAKVSVVIDGGGSIGLDGIAADIRLRAQSERDGLALRLAVGGDGANAVPLGDVAPAEAAEGVMRLLGVLAGCGRDARARDIVRAEGAAVFRSVVADLLSPGESKSLHQEARTGEAIGSHRLRDGTLACGIGLAFGHADAASLQRLVEAADAAGAHGLRTAPGRALIAVGLTAVSAPTFFSAADRHGFIAHPNDPRRHVVACAGAPVCASAHIVTRTMAPVIAKDLAPHLAGAFTVHLSGCAKGCARAAPSPLTVVGTPEGCALVANGFARDAPFAVVPATDLPAAIARYARQRPREAAHA